MNKNDFIKEKMECWTAEEQARYLCPNGTMTIEEFREYGHQIIDEEYDRLGW